jgi:predicted Zn-dependent protease
VADTATRLAAAPALKLKPARQEKTKSLQAKYDITRIGDRGIGNRLNFFSLEREEALGRELSQQVEQQAKLVTDPVITEYVNRIGQTLVRHSDAHVPFTIKVVDDEQVNAFALPGGFFYVNTGIVLAAENEAELAGVMAHEIAHVAARHATVNATRQEIWNLASLPLIFVGGPVGAAIRQVSGIMVPMSFLKFSRDAEREADFLGLEYQYASGYDPTAFVDFFEKLEAQQKGHPGFVARAFSTHPMNDDRIRRAEAELEMLPARNDYIVSTSEFDQVKARLIHLTRGHSITGEKPGLPTLRKHTVQDDNPPVLRKKPGAMQ